MPIYEYLCPACQHRFTHFFASIRLAQESEPPACPRCGHALPERLISQVAVLGERGPDAAEVAAERAAEERMASITPKEMIEKLRAGKKPKS
jgi:putative FmdB family regulatory protein